MENIGEYINDPNALGRPQADALEILREKYPYFQALHILIAKCHKNQNTFGFNKNLKLASLYAGDRKVLYNFINAEPEALKEPENEQPIYSIEQPVGEIEPNTPDEKIEDKISLTDLPDLNPKLVFEVIKPTGETTFSESYPEPDLQTTDNQETRADLELSEKKITPTELIYPFAWEDETNEFLDKQTEINHDVLAATEKPSEVDNTKEVPPVEELSEEIVQVTEEIVEIPETTDEKPDDESDKNNLVEPEIPIPLIETLPEEALEFKEPGNKQTNEQTQAETDFYSWLDNFTSTETAKDKESEHIEIQGVENLQHEENLPEPDHKEYLSETQPEEISTGDQSRELPMEDNLNLPLNFEELEDEEENKYDPAAWAEIAYDIQAFVKHPEIEEKEIQFSPKKISKPEIDDLLDRFIKRNPSISRPKAEFYKPENMAKKSEEFHGEVASETLAGLFYKQGLLHQSLEIYEKLVLQNPDKKGIFAARIKSIKEELINRL